MDTFLWRNTQNRKSLKMKNCTLIQWLFYFQISERFPISLCCYNVFPVVHKLSHTHRSVSGYEIPITNDSGLNPKQPSNRLSKSLLHTIPSQLQFRFDPSLSHTHILCIVSNLVVLSGSYYIGFDGHCLPSSLGKWAMFFSAVFHW